MTAAPAEPLAVLTVPQLAAEAGLPVDRVRLLFRRDQRLAALARHRVGPHRVLHRADVPAAKQLLAELATPKPRERRATLKDAINALLAQAGAAG